MFSLQSFRVLYNIPKDLPNFLQSSFIWCFQVKRLSKIIPRYFILGDSKIVTPFKRSITLSFKLAWGGLKIKNSVLLALRERRLEQSHSKSFLSSRLITLDINLGFLTLNSRLVSSAKWKTEQLYNLINLFNFLWYSWNF